MFGKCTFCRYNGPDLTFSMMSVQRSLDEYENLAVNLALDPKRLSQLKKRIIENKDLILFNSKLFTENLEKAYKTVHQIYNSDLEKKDIFIN